MGIFPQKTLRAKRNLFKVMPIPQVLKSCINWHVMHILAKPVHVHSDAMHARYDDAGHILTEVMNALTVHGQGNSQYGTIHFSRHANCRIHTKP
jgi:hypothetical protein